MFSRIHYDPNPPWTSGRVSMEDVRGTLQNTHRRRCEENPGEHPLRCELTVNESCLFLFRGTLERSSLTSDSKTADGKHFHPYRQIQGFILLWIRMTSWGFI